MRTQVTRAILLATLVCGTLDILSAFLFSAIDGVTPATVLKFVASGPFGSAMLRGGAGAAVLGLAVHYLLMAVMVTLFVIAASRIPLLRRRWVLSGLLYGLAIYAVMYWLVLPARFGMQPRLDAWHLGNALFAHIACVGWPMAFIAARRLGRD